MKDAVGAGGFAEGVTGRDAGTGYSPTTISADLRYISFSADVGGEVLLTPRLPEAEWDAALLGLAAPRLESARDVLPGLTLSRRAVIDPLLKLSIVCTSGSLPSPIKVIAFAAAVDAPDLPVACGSLSASTG